MHVEIQHTTRQFRNVGYPAWLIHDKINNTLGSLLHKSNPAHYPNPFPQKDPSDLPPKWSVLFLPWSGTAAGAIVNKIRKSLPREQSRISIAYTTTRLRNLLPRYSSCSPPENKIQFLCDVVYKYQGCRFASKSESKAKQTLLFDIFCKSKAKQSKVGCQKIFRQSKARQSKVKQSEVKNWIFLKIFLNFF